MNCPYCGALVKLADSKTIYGKSYGSIWICSNYPACDSYVGCHPGSTRPLGTVANAELRLWRHKAHEAFDPIWKSRKMSRGQAYKGLAAKMDLLSEQCHIGMFNIGQCKKVITLLGGNIIMYQNDAMKVLTGKVRLSYAALTTPRAPQQGGEAKYSVTLLIPKTDVATKADIDSAIQAAAQDGMEKTWKGVRPPMLKTPIHDGDGVRESGEPFGDECKGHWVMTASSKQKPQVVDQSLSEIVNASDIYSGMYARVTIRFFAYANSGNKGIGCGLNNVLKVEDGEPLSGHADAASDFAGIAQAPYPVTGIAPNIAGPAYGYPSPAPTYPQYTPQAPAAPQYPQYAPQQPTYSQQPTTYPQSPAQPVQPQIDPITGRPMTGPIMGL